MVGSPLDQMNVGILHFMAYPQCMCGEGPIVETVASIADDLFFDHIELTQMKSPLVRSQVHEIVEASRIAASFGAQPIILGGNLDLNHPDRMERHRAVKAVQWGIEQARELSCDSVTVLSGPVTEDRKEAKERLVDSLKRLCAYGSPRGIQIRLETFDQVAYGKNGLIGPTEDAVEVSEEVRKEYSDFGIVVDLSHLPLMDETAKKALDVARDHLVHVHIGNCAMDNPQHPAYGDNHPRFGASGTRNDVPELAEFLRHLLDMGYTSAEHRRPVCFEVKPMPGERPESVIAGSKRALLAAWRMV